MTSEDQQVEVKKGHEVSLWASIGAARTVVVGDQVGRFSLSGFARGEARR